MLWIGSELAWEARALAAEAAHQMCETGRICYAPTCSARSEIAFQVEVQESRWYAGFCLAHAVEFASAHADLVVGIPRRLEPDDVLDGPLAEVEDEDNDE